MGLQRIQQDGVTFTFFSRLFYFWYIIYTMPTPATYLLTLLENSLELPNGSASPVCLHRFWLLLRKRVITAYWILAADLTSLLQAGNLSCSFWSPQHRRLFLDSRCSIHICWMVDPPFALMFTFQESPAIISDFHMPFGTVRTYPKLLHLLTGGTGFSVMSNMRKRKEISFESWERWQWKKLDEWKPDHLC